MDRDLSEIGSATARQSQTELPFRALLAAFGAEEGVPGSGSANALTASLAAALVASVATKTSKGGMKYIAVSETATTVERQARKLEKELLGLIDEDSQPFALVISLRREAKSEMDKIRQDQAHRQEISAMTPATETPLEVARLALEVGRLAVRMLEVGYIPARGESFAALLQSIAAADGSLFVARLNIDDIRRKINNLNDPELERHWLETTVPQLQNFRIQCRELRAQEARFRRSSERALAASTSTKRKKRRQVTSKRRD